MNIPQIPPQRVKVLAAVYDQASDTVAWQVRLADGREADLVWLRQDYGQEVFKINGVMPVAIVEESCQKVLNKEYNLKVEPTTPENSNLYEQLKRIRQMMQEQR